MDRQFHQNNVDSPYRGKGDWLQILIDAVDGDPISARNSQYAAVMQGKFLRNPETGKIEIQMMLPDGQLTGPLPELTFVNYGAGRQRYSLESSKYNTHVGQLYYLPGVCGTVWDCTAIQLDAASLLLSAGGDALITCIPESLGLCGGGAIVAKAADRAVTYAAVLHTADMIYQGKAGPVDAAMVGVSTRFSTRPVLGEVFGITQLLYDLVVDPITPGW